tara:strand:- start:280 stop:615 length:336 start_codon:yes stop_codon:yes gene_type:complete
MNLPKLFDVGPFQIRVVLIDSDYSHDVGEQYGSYVERSNTIYLDKGVIDRGGPDAVNLVIHELMHVIYRQYSLLNKTDEELIVNAFANGLTELFKRTQLLKWVKYTIGKNK